MKLVEVLSKEQIREFVNFPKSLYRDNPEWVMPLDEDIYSTFDVSKNEAFSRDGKAKKWLVYKDKGEVVGRIAAFCNLTPKGDKEGGAGFFESINDQKVANMLFNAAATFLKSEGFAKMEAPINFGDRDSFWGLMVEGFKNHSYRENFNFPYYQNLMESYGFEKVIEQSTSEVKTKDFNYERFSKLATRVYANPKYEFKYLDWNKVEQFADDFKEIYNKAWSTHDFFVPMTKEKIYGRMKLMKAIAPSELNVFAYADGKPAAFYLNVLDVNQIFKHINGKLNLLGKLKFLWYKGKVNRVRGIVFGIIPEFQNTGIEVGMIMKFYESIKDHPVIKSSELAWIGDFNPKMHSMFKSLGATRVKMHYTYSKDL